MDGHMAIDGIKKVVKMEVRKDFKAIKEEK
jgi:hypothetical protein